MVQNGNRMEIAWKKVGFGVCVSMLGTILLAAVSAWLVSSELLPEEGIRYLPLGIVGLCAFLGAGIAGGRESPLNRLAVGVLYWAGLLALNLLMCDGSPVGVIPTLLMSVCGSGVAVLLLRSTAGRNRRRGRRRHRR